MAGTDSPRAAHLPRSLAPVGGFTVQRIGPEHDGGYVVASAALAPTTWLLSLGLADDWRFERDFQLVTGADVTAVDATTGPQMWAQHGVVRAFLTASGRRFRAPLSDYYNHETGYLRYRKFFADASREHLRQWVGDGADGTVSIAELLASRPGAATFLKMDIEGSEWRTLADILAGQERFTGMVIEFHDVDLHLDRLTSFVAELDEFAVVAAAANNAGRVTRAGTPTVVEFTFARRDQQVAAAATGGAVDDFPSGSPNVPFMPPIALNFEP